MNFTDCETSAAKPKTSWAMVAFAVFVFVIIGCFLYRNGFNGTGTLVFAAVLVTIVFLFLIMIMETEK